MSFEKDIESVAKDELDEFEKDIENIKKGELSKLVIFRESLREGDLNDLLEAIQASASKNFKELVLNENQLSEDDLLIIGKMTTLRVLRLALTDIQDGWISHLLTIEQLEEVDFSSNPITQVGLQAFLPYLKKPRKTPITVNFSNTKIREKDLTEILADGFLTKHKIVLKLRGGQFSLETLRKVAEINEETIAAAEKTAAEAEAEEMHHESKLEKEQKRDAEGPLGKIAGEYSKEDTDLDNKEDAELNDLVSDDCRCPFTGSYMRDPVITQAETTYERENIERWFNSSYFNDKREPFVRTVLTDISLTPNTAVKQKIDGFREKIRAKRLQSSLTKLAIESPLPTPIPTLEKGPTDNKEEKLPPTATTNGTPKETSSSNPSPSSSPSLFFELISTAAESGDANAQFSLGDWYMSGRLGTRDPATAMQWYKKAAEQNHINAQFRLAVGYMEGEGVTEDPTKAMAWFQKAAEAGDSYAQFNLGSGYMIGKGVARNPVEAMKWFAKAAEAGNLHAQFNLAVSYMEGRIVARNPIEAVKRFRQAAEAGYPHAQSNLGYCYLTGEGVGKDLAEAVKWFRKAAEFGVPQAQLGLATVMKEFEKAAELGDPNAQFNLGVCYERVARNPTKAAEWYKRAAEHNHVSAQFNLALCYANGEGVTKNPAEAMKWFLKAAKQQDESALRVLGYYHENGIDSTPRNPKLAFGFYQKAAELKDAAGLKNKDALTAMGWCYENGHGVKADSKQAAEYYKQAAQQKDKYAQAVCYDKGYGETRNLAKAIEYYRQAAEEGHQRAQTELGLCYEQGRGVHQDILKAQEWYQKAAESNYLPAKERLAALRNQTTTAPTPSSSGINSSVAFFNATTETKRAPSTASSSPAPSADLLEQPGVSELYEDIAQRAEAGAAPIIAAIKEHLGKETDPTAHANKVCKILRELKGLMTDAATTSAQDSIYETVFNAIKTKLDSKRLSRIDLQPGIPPENANVLREICPHLFSSMKVNAATAHL